MVEDVFAEDSPGFDSEVFLELAGCVCGPVGFFFVGFHVVFFGDGLSFFGLGGWFCGYPLLFEPGVEWVFEIDADHVGVFFGFFLCEVCGVL